MLEIKNIHRYVVIFLTVVGIWNVTPVMAASPQDIIKFQTALGELNRIKPLQNPRHEGVGDILNRTIIDRENKVIGEVEDVLVGADGYVASLSVVFDCLQLNQGVFLNYATHSVSNASNGYKIGLNREEVELSYADLLADIETASGSQTDIISVAKLRGRDVIGNNSIKIGQISDILFDSSGAFIRSIYVNVNYRAIRNRGVAVPFDIFKFVEKHGKVIATIDQDYADAIIAYAKENL